MTHGIRRQDGPGALFTPLRVVVATAFSTAALVILWFEVFWRYCVWADREPSAMPGAELRTNVFGAVVSVLLGVGIGFGWYYFADSVGVRAVASAATPPAQHDAPNPPSSNPSARQERPVLDVPRASASSDTQQVVRSNPRNEGCDNG